LSLHAIKVRAHSLILTYELPHRRIQPAERERIHPPMPGTIISRSQPLSRRHQYTRDLLD